MPERVPVRVVRTGAVDYIEVPTADEVYVEALRRERAGYLTRGLPERAAAVTAELIRVGAEAPQQEGADSGRGQGQEDRRAGGRRRDADARRGRGAAGR